MQEEKSHAFSMRELLAFFCKYSRRLTAAFVLPLFVALGVSFIPAPVYTASSVLIVRLGSEYVYQPEIGSSQTSSEMAIPYQQDQIFKSEAAILDSKDLHRQVIEYLGASRIYPEGALRAELAPLFSWVEARLVAYGVKKPATPEEQQKQRIAAAVERFNKNLDIRLEKESAVINVKFQHKDSKTAAVALNTLLKFYLDKRKQLYLEPRLKMAEGQVEATRQRAMAAEKAVDDYKRSKELHSLEIQRANLLAARNDVEKQRISLSSAALDQKAEHYNQELDELSRQELRYSALEHDAKIANAEYALAVHNRSEAKAFDDLSREREGSVRIIQPAVVPPNPASLQPLILLVGIFLSIVSFFFVAAITEFRKSGFLTPEDLERNLNIPVLSVLPYRGDQS